MGSTTFSEVMAGTVRLHGEDADRQLRLDLRVSVPGVMRPWGDSRGVLAGRVRLPDRIDDQTASGTIRIAPIAARQIRYSMSCTALDGERLLLDGWKSITGRHPVRSMTVLPITVYDECGRTVGSGILRFDLRRDLLRFLGGFRYRRARGGAGRRSRVDRTTHTEVDARG